MELRHRHHMYDDLRPLYQRFAVCPNNSTTHSRNFQNFIFRPYFIWERKIFKSKGFLHKIWQASNLYLTLRVLPIKFNSYKVSFIRFVFVEDSRLFLVDPNDPEWPKNNPKRTPKQILQNFPFFYVLIHFCQCFNRCRVLEWWKGSTRQVLVVQ